jgi:hypothetical protein
VATNAEEGSSGVGLLTKDEDETGYNSNWDVQLLVVIGWQVLGLAQSLSDEGDTKKEAYNTRRYTTVCLNVLWPCEDLVKEAMTPAVFNGVY